MHKAPHSSAVVTNRKDMWCHILPFTEPEFNKSKDNSGSIETENSEGCKNLSLRKPTFNVPKHYTGRHGYGGDTSCVQDLSARCRRVVSCTLWPLYLQQNSPWYPLDKSLARPHSQPGCGSKQNNLCPYWELNPWPSSLQPVTSLTELFWLLIISLHTKNCSYQWAAQEQRLASGIC